MTSKYDQVRLHLLKRREDSLKHESSSHPQSPSSVYGFVVWMFSFVAFGMYLLWAFVPDRVLKEMGFFYLPNKYWAVAIPTWFCLFLVLIPLVYKLLCYIQYPTPSHK